MDVTIDYAVDKHGVYEKPWSINRWGANVLKPASLTYYAIAIPVVFVAVFLALYNFDKLSDEFNSIEDLDRASRISVFIIIGVASMTLGWGIPFGMRFHLSRLVSVIVDREGYNDDATSISYTLKVINQAQKWLVLYDYGEREASNIYYSSKIEKALIAKLNINVHDDSKDFKVGLIFKDDEEKVETLPLIIALRKWQDDNKELAVKVRVTYNVDRANEEYAEFNRYCESFPYHYKINDRAYAYLTRHQNKPGDRIFKYSTPMLGWPVHRVQDCLNFHTIVENGQNV